MRPYIKLHTKIKSKMGSRYQNVTIKKLKDIEENVQENLVIVDQEKCFTDNRCTN